MPIQNKGEALHRIFNDPDWEAVAEIIEALIKKFQVNLTRINLAESMEKIAADRIRWTSMISAYEVLLTEIGKEIEEYKKAQEKGKETENDGRESE